MFADDAVDWYCWDHIQSIFVQLINNKTLTASQNPFQFKGLTHLWQLNNSMGA